MNPTWIERPRNEDESSALRRSSEAIPLPKSHLNKTKSEIQLSEDLAAAEWRELCMFYRVVNGIRDRQGKSTEAQSVLRRKPSDALVTPYDSSNEASPFTFHKQEKSIHSHQQQGFLHQTMMSDYDDGPFTSDNDWSICGYDNEPIQTPMQLNVVEHEETEENETEPAMFDMDL